MANKLETIGKSSTGMDENIAALVSIIVAPITSLIFFMIEKDSKFVKFHAAQSGILAVALYVLGFIFGIIPIIGWLLALILPLVAFVLFIILLIKAYNGEWYELPIIGEIAMQQAEK